MGLERVGKVRLSKSGRALEVYLDNLPNTTFSMYLYVPRHKVKEILDNKLAETTISLFTGREG